LDGSIGLRAWHAVRVLSGPPLTLPNRKISRSRPRSPQMAGSCGCVSVSAETVSGLKAILGGLSLGRGIPFPRCRSILDEDWSDVVATTREDQASGADGTIPRAGRRGGATPNPYRRRPSIAALPPRKRAALPIFHRRVPRIAIASPPATSETPERERFAQIPNPRAGASKARLTIPH
jgi:hypothetical protein